MKIIYTAFLLFFFAPVFSQSFQVGHLQGNPVLRSHAAKEEARVFHEMEKMTGFKPSQESAQRMAGDCPPELPFELIVVASGETMTVEVDTFGLEQPGNDTTILSLLSPAVGTLGTAELLPSPYRIRYTANAGFLGLGEEAIQVQYAQGAFTDTIEIILTVTRAGQTIVAPTQTLNAEASTTYCLTDELAFSSPLSCVEFVGCVNDYPGDGNQLFYFTEVPGVLDTCIFYRASRFPGVDTVCVQICDELAVCDVFKIPFEIIGDTLSISAAEPFFEDFSQNDGPYPMASRWLDRDVFVNNTFAANPPSVGMATFDGLDFRGQPYPIDNVGIGDRLTSKPIDLSAFAEGDVLSLRYFAAPKGYGQDPENNDTLKLEFLTAAGKWVQVDFLNGGDWPINTSPPFEFRGIALDDDDYFHDAFQFRFTAKVSPGGYGDWWHLDYIYLGAVGADNSNFDDVAFVNPPNGFLKNYTSMPFRHYKPKAADETGGENVLSVFFNHFDNTRNLSSSFVKFTETTTGNNIGGSSFPVVFDGTDNNILPSQFEERQRDNPAENMIATNLSALSDAEFRRVVTEYSFSLEQDPFALLNDTVRHETIFSNYFAHDDGTAEQAFFVSFAQGYEQVAQHYRANVDDELHAVQIMFPHFAIADLEDQFFTLKVWIDGNSDANLADEEVVYERELLRPFFADEVYDTLQGFTTYLLEDILGEAMPVELKANDNFYVGWEYNTIAELSFTVGLDVQNDCDCAVVNLDGGDTFTPMPFNGALMIRPVMQPQPFNTSSGTTDIAQVKPPFTIYPNPTGGTLNLKLESGRYKDYKILVFNNLGQLVASPNAAASLDLSQLGSGTFHLQISDMKNGGHFMKRIVIQK